MPRLMLMPTPAAFDAVRVAEAYFVICCMSGRHYQPPSPGRHITGYAEAAAVMWPAFEALRQMLIDASAPRC